MLVRKWLYCLAGSILLAVPAVARQWKISSPSAVTSLEFSLNENGAPFYALHYKGKPVIHPSEMGFTLKDIPSFLQGFEMVQMDSSFTNENWHPVLGEEALIHNVYKQLKVTLREKAAPGRLLEITFRLFDDGLGFRYGFPRQPGLDNFIVAEENTRFRLAGNHKAFWIPGDYDTNEFPYNTTLLSEVDAADPRFTQNIHAMTFFVKNAVQTPLMLKSKDGLYINIHEAELVNYPAMQLLVNKEDYSLQSTLVPDALGNKAYLQTPAVTPWRTIVVSDKAAGILSSRIVLNLNEPSVVKNTSFIKPVKYLGIWWEMHVGKSTWDLAATQVAGQMLDKSKHGATTARTKFYIDFAAKHGFQGVLVEGWNTGWEDWFGKWKEDVFDFVTPYPDYDVAELTRYGKEKGVQLIMHHETSGAVTSYERSMDTAFRFMKKYGIDAVKTGYVGKIIPRGEHHDGQWMVNHIKRVAEKAASYGIMVNSHESVRPTGLHRTYPNYIAAEAGRGMEYNAWSSGNPPEHETILPFTRLMGGPMDYTPGIFRIKLDYWQPGKKEQVQTTLTKQLALYVTLYSPLQMAADLPEVYEERMDAFQFIKDVPADWEKTVVLEAEPGDYLAIARQGKGSQQWFIGAITDEQKREMILPLDFLDKGKKYTATIYKDAPQTHWQKNPEQYIIEKRAVTSSTRLKILLAEGGGCAVSIFPE